jgi:hypothetical protein
MANIQERPLLKGSITDKMEQVEKHIRKLNRRRGNYVVGVTPPIPVFDWTKDPDETGVVFRKLMPGNGKITLGCMYVEELNKNMNPQAVLDIEGQLGGTRVKIPINRQTMSIEPKMDVEFGQRLTLSISPPAACSGIWTAFLFEVDVKHTKEQEQLVDGFMELVEKADKELDNA